MEAIVTGPPAAKRATLHTRCFDTGSDGDPNGAMVLADLVPKRSSRAPRTIVEDTGRPVYQPVPPAVKHSVEQSQPQFTAVFTEDKNGFYINGRKFMMDSPPVLTVQIGSTSIGASSIRPTKYIHSTFIRFTSWRMPAMTSGCSSRNDWTQSMYRRWAQWIL
jgi:hypothetical protein